jgi:taurine dioxygenase
MSASRIGRFTCREMQPFGIKVEGVDLNQPLTAEEEKAIPDLLFRHGVVVFENQDLSDARQREIMAVIGRVSAGYNGFSMLDPDGELGRTKITFHSDYAFTSKPMTALSLFGVDVSEGQSCTNFASGVRALAEMPQALKDRIAGKQSRAVLPKDQGLVQLYEPFPEGMPSIVRDIVVDHPMTGEKIVYIHELQCCGIEGMEKAEAQALVEEVFAEIYRPDNIYSHMWKNGDLVIWDNMSMQHGRPPLGDNVKKRSLRRIGVAEKELLELCPDFAKDDAVVAQLSRGKIVAKMEGGASHIAAE